ncbi:hypothetical protein T440DRAFT_472838 [Plenodomus tracheiphilus IPT5]|uniref:Uncharacterized protein n=1 Tax=Plenodomus tracheiphilus IPT5 TaxID=1408161 RepID=A0A6A7APP7_9PLEO|nr:hypothetical protein T440DRAFT_472838 [Plenodomus tracheiphilus IPT5]
MTKLIMQTAISGSWLCSQASRAEGSTDVGCAFHQRCGGFGALIAIVLGAHRPRRDCSPALSAGNWRRWSRSCCTDHVSRMSSFLGDSETFWGGELRMGGNILFGATDVVGCINDEDDDDNNINDGQMRVCCGGW